MNSEFYIKNAISTESPLFDSGHVEKEKFYLAIKLFSSVGNALNQIKRALYYGKKMDKPKLDGFMGDASNITNRWHDDLVNTCISVPGYSKSPSVSPRIIHGALGLGTESGEILQSLMESLNENKEIDLDNLFEELGDIFWYIALIIDEARKEKIRRTTSQMPLDFAAPNEWSFENIMEKNIAKLKARFPDKFSTENAYNRNIENEKNSLKS